MRNYVRLQKIPVEYYPLAEDYPSPEKMREMAFDSAIARTQRKIGIDSYIIDPDLSSVKSGGLVLRNVETGKYVVSYHGALSGAKGTDPEAENYKKPISESAEAVDNTDIRSYKSAITSLRDHTPTIYGEEAPKELYGLSIDEQMQKLIEKAGAENIHLVGYSNGGIKVHYIVRKYAVGSATIFDGVLGLRQTADMALGNKSPITYVRTTEKALAMEVGQNVAQTINPNARNVDIITVPPMRDLGAQVGSSAVLKPDGTRLTGPRELAKHIVNAHGDGPYFGDDGTGSVRMPEELQKAPGCRQQRSLFCFFQEKKADEGARGGLRGVGELPRRALGDFLATQPAVIFNGEGETGRHWTARLVLLRASTF